MELGSPRPGFCPKSETQLPREIEAPARDISFIKLGFIAKTLQHTSPAQQSRVCRRRILTPTCPSPYYRRKTCSACVCLSSRLNCWPLSKQRIHPGTIHSKFDVASTTLITITTDFSSSHEKTLQATSKTQVLSYALRTRRTTYVRSGHLIASIWLNPR